VPASAYWRCPICLRRVPDKVAECYCGRTRQASDGPDEDDQPKPAGAAQLLALVALVGAGALAYVTIGRERPVPVASASPASSQGAQDAGRSFAPVVTPHPESTMPAGWTPAPPSTQPATPRPPAASESLDDDGVDARRESGRLAYEAAAANLQGRMDQLRRRVENLDRSCSGLTQIRGCDSLRDDLARAADGLREVAEGAEEAARRSWVDPGFIREVRERYSIRDGDVDALLNEVDAALKR